MRFGGKIMEEGGTWSRKPGRVEGMNSGRVLEFDPVFDPGVGFLYLFWFWAWVMG